MAQTNLFMNHDNGSAVLVLIVMDIGHLITASIQPFLWLLTGIYVLYNIRLQVVGAGGIKPYLKSWLKWKK